MAENNAVNKVAVRFRSHFRFPRDI
jgi:hypothetical protein